MMIDDPRPQAPEAPLPGDCCGGGCFPCVLDAHEEALDAYHDQLLNWMQRHSPPPRPSAARSDAVRMVLDTNVSLDLLVFRDPRFKPLVDAIGQGTCDVLMRTDCREEFIRVTGYPQFERRDGQRVRLLEAFDALHRFPLAGECREPAVDLPSCRDPDDQKFLELAHEARADVLLSKDKALLKLDRRNRRAGRFRILSPQDWVVRTCACAATI